jgi:hypothetical protein
MDSSKGFDSDDQPLFGMGMPSPNSLSASTKLAGLSKSPYILNENYVNSKEEKACLKESSNCQTCKSDVGKNGEGIAS